MNSIPSNEKSLETDSQKKNKNQINTSKENHQVAVRQILPHHIQIKSSQNLCPIITLPQTPAELHSKKNKKDLQLPSRVATRLIDEDASNASNRQQDEQQMRKNLKGGAENMKSAGLLRGSQGSGGVVNHSSLKIKNNNLTTQSSTMEQLDCGESHPDLHILIRKMLDNDQRIAELQDEQTTGTTDSDTRDTRTKAKGTGQNEDIFPAGNPLLQEDQDVKGTVYVNNNQDNSDSYNIVDEPAGLTQSDEENTILDAICRSKDQSAQSAPKIKDKSLKFKYRYLRSKLLAQAKYGYENNRQLINQVIKEQIKQKYAQTSPREASVGNPLGRRAICQPLSMPIMNDIGHDFILIDDAKGKGGQLRPQPQLTSSLCHKYKHVPKIPSDSQHKSPQLQQLINKYASGSQSQDYSIFQNDDLQKQKISRSELRKKQMSLEICVVQTPSAVGEEKTESGCSPLVYQLSIKPRINNPMRTEDDSKMTMNLPEERKMVSHMNSTRLMKQSMQVSKGSQRFMDSSQKPMTALNEDMQVVSNQGEMESNQLKKRNFDGPSATGFMFGQNRKRSIALGVQGLSQNQDQSKRRFQSINQKHHRVLDRSTKPLRVSTLMDFTKIQEYVDNQMFCDNFKLIQQQQLPASDININLEMPKVGHLKQYGSDVRPNESKGITNKPTQMVVRETVPCYRNDRVGASEHPPTNPNNYFTSQISGNIKNTIASTLKVSPNTSIDLPKQSQTHKKENGSQSMQINNQNMRGISEDEARALQSQNVHSHAFMTNVRHQIALKESILEESSRLSQFQEQTPRITPHNFLPLTHGQQLPSKIIQSSDRVNLGVHGAAEGASGQVDPTVVNAPSQTPGGMECLVDSDAILRESFDQGIEKINSQRSLSQSKKDGRESPISAPNKEEANQVNRNENP